MLDGVFNFDPQALLVIVVRTATVYLFLLVALRLTGKRELGQLNPFDLVLILVLSNAVQNAMTGPDTSLTGGITAAIVLLLINLIFSAVVNRNPTVRQLLEGSPTLLVHDSAFIPAHLAKEKITEDEVLEALREHGIDKVSQCQSAVLEVDGSISVITNGDESNKPLPSHVRHRRRYTQHRS